MSKPTILITGCAGFIGSHVTDTFLKAGYRVIGYDSFTYAGKASNLHGAMTYGNQFTLVRGDIQNKNRLISTIKETGGIDWIVNLAAETHVDNSIHDCGEFINTNINGTKVLLDVCREIGCKLLHFSTDEVYGVSPLGIPFTETDNLNPRNPYAATKAGADHMIKAYANTYGTEYLLVRPSNNFGVRQHNEKFIPTIINSLRNNKKIPIYGEGNQIREWTSVKETAKATVFILENSPINETYNITSGFYAKNIDVVRAICSFLSLEFSAQVEYVKDRLGHDFRYSVSSDKLDTLGYKVLSDFTTELKEVIYNDFIGLRNTPRVD